MTPSNCPLCRQPVYRDRAGKLVPHTTRVIGDSIGDKVRAEMCSGSDWSALS